MAFWMDDLRSMELTSSLAQGALVATVDDCDSWPDTATLSDLGPVLCFATITHFPSYPVPELVLLAGRVNTTTMNILRRGVNSTFAPVSWSAGAVISQRNSASVYNAVGNVSGANVFRCEGATSAAHSDPGLGKCRFHGSDTPSLCTELAINKTAQGGWPMLQTFNTVLTFGNLCIIRMKYMLIGGGPESAPGPKLGPATTDRIELHLNGNPTDFSTYWVFPFPVTEIWMNSSMSDTSDGVCGILSLDHVRGLVVQA